MTNFVYIYGPKNVAKLDITYPTRDAFMTSYTTLQDNLGALVWQSQDHNILTWIEEGSGDSTLTLQNTLGATNSMISSLTLSPQKLASVGCYLTYYDYAALSGEATLTGKIYLIDEDFIIQRTLDMQIRAGTFINYPLDMTEIS